MRALNENIVAKVRQARSRINPTLLLFIGIVSVFFSNILITIVFNPLPYIAVGMIFCIQTLMLFLMFTVVHDAVHRSASPRRWLNSLMLYGGWPIFLNNPQLFKKLHLDHHARTNQTGLDPDHFTASPYLAGRWCKSFLLIFYYYYFAAMHYRSGPKDYFMTGSSMLLPLFALFLAFYTPYFQTIFISWLLPGFTAIGLLAYANTAWPHHHGGQKRESEIARYSNTRCLFVPRFLQWIMLNQNLHLVHHLRPSLPWYKYPEFWRQSQAEIQSKGGRTTSYTRRADPSAF